MRLLKALLILIVAAALVLTGLIGVAMFAVVGATALVVRSLRRGRGPVFQMRFPRNHPRVQGEAIDVEASRVPVESDER